MVSLLNILTKTRASDIFGSFCYGTERVYMKNTPTHLKGRASCFPPGSRRPERDPGKRRLWEHNKKIILATQNVCGICGKPVDKNIKSPDPMSPTVDHIIPVSRNGDPVALENLQLAHRYCNRMKSDNIQVNAKAVDNNRALPQSVNWRTF